MVEFSSILTRNVSWLIPAPFTPWGAHVAKLRTAGYQPTLIEKGLQDVRLSEERLRDQVATGVDDVTMTKYRREDYI